MLHLSSNNRFYLGLFAAASKKDLNTAACWPEVDVLDRLPEYPGRATLLDTYGADLYVKKEEGTQEEAEKYQKVHCGDMPTLPVKLEMHIDVQKQTVTWKCNNGNGGLIVEAPLPYPPPIYLLYQSADPLTVITIDGVELK